MSHQIPVTEKPMIFATMGENTMRSSLRPPPRI